MPQEKFPLHFECVIEERIRRLGDPSVLIVDWTVLIGVPEAAGGGGVVLHRAVAKTGDGGTIGPIDLQGQQIVTLHSDAPGRVEVADHPVLQLERCVGRVVGRALVRFTVLVPTLGQVGGSQAGEGFDFSKKILDHVLPMAEHVDDDSAVVFLTVVPRRAL